MTAWNSSGAKKSETRNMLPSKPEGREPIRTNGTRSETARDTKVQVFKGRETRKGGVPVPVGLKQILTPKILGITVVPVGNLKDCYLPLFGGPMP